MDYRSSVSITRFGFIVVLFVISNGLVTDKEGKKKKKRSSQTEGDIGVCYGL